MCVCVCVCVCESMFQFACLKDDGYFYTLLKSCSHIFSSCKGKVHYYIYKQRFKNKFTCIISCPCRIAILRTQGQRVDTVI